MPENALGHDDRTSLHMRCGKCASENLWIDTCPEHDWILAGGCRDCGLDWCPDLLVCHDCKESTDVAG